MPKLNQWSVVAGTNNNWRMPPDNYTAPEKITQHLNGNISMDNRFKDGDNVTTSTIKGKRNGKVVTGSGTEYELGEVSMQYESEYPDARSRLMESLPELP